MELSQIIREIADFPTPGVLFRDITPLLGDAQAFSQTLDAFERLAKVYMPDAIIGIESRGFIFAAPLADRMKLPFVPVRKPGKLPATRLSVEYSLEYGSSQLDIHADALQPGARAVIIDDVLATGGTARATAKLVELIHGHVAGFAFLMEIEALGGRAALADYPVEALIKA